MRPVRPRFRFHSRGRSRFRREPVREPGKTWNSGRSRWRRGRRRPSDPGKHRFDRGPNRKFRGRHDDVGHGLENQQDFGLKTTSRNRGRVLGLFGVLDELAHAAEIVPCERQPDRFRDRHRLRIGRDHASPPKRLHQIPMTPGGEKPRGEREDEGDALTHGSKAENVCSVDQQAEFTGRADSEPTVGAIGQSAHTLGTAAADPLDRGGSLVHWTEGEREWKAGGRIWLVIAFRWPKPRI